jgi:hypothetical protein
MTFDNVVLFSLATLFCDVRFCLGVSEFCLCLPLSAVPVLAYLYLRYAVMFVLLSVALVHNKLQLFDFISENMDTILLT